MIYTAPPSTRLRARMIGRGRRQRQRRLNRRTEKVEDSTSYSKNKFYIRKCRKDEDITKKGAVDDSAAVDNVTCQILSRLPVRSLTRCKCVCKQWRLLVEKDSFFKDLHLTHSKSRLKYFCIVQEPSESSYKHGPSKKVFLVTADYLSHSHAVNIDNIREVEVPYHASFFGPLNGLVGFYDSGRYSGIRILNVCIQETITPWMESALVRKYISQDGFKVQNVNCELGFDPITKKHKVVSLCKIRYSDRGYGMFCEVLTIGDYEWRICEVPSTMIDELRPIRGSVYVNGSIYFSTVSLGGNDDGGILVFDVGSENFRSIAIPDFSIDRPVVYTGRASFDVDLFEMDDHLAFFCRTGSYKVRIWIYDDGYDDGYKLKSCWTEFTIVLPYRWDTNYWEIITFHSVVGKNQIILKFSQRLPMDGQKKEHSYHLYDQTKKTYTQIDICGIPCSFPYFLDGVTHVKTFVESFLSVQCD